MVVVFFTCVSVFFYMGQCFFYMGQGVFGCLHVLQGFVTCCRNLLTCFYGVFCMCQGTCVTRLCYMRHIGFVYMCYRGLFTCVTVFFYMCYRGFNYLFTRVTGVYSRVLHGVCFLRVTGVYSRVLHGVCLHVLQGFIHVCYMLHAACLQRLF